MASHREINSGSPLEDHIGHLCANMYPDHLEPQYNPGLHIIFLSFCRVTTVGVVPKGVKVATNMGERKIYVRDESSKSA